MNVEWEEDPIRVKKTEECYVFIGRKGFETRGWREEERRDKRRRKEDMGLYKNETRMLP